MLEKDRSLEVARGRVDALEDDLTDLRSKMLRAEAKERQMTVEREEVEAEVVKAREKLEKAEKKVEEMREKVREIIREKEEDTRMME
jgi:chromosome segregation ATPase